MITFTQYLLLEAREDFVAQQLGPKLTARYAQDVGGTQEPINIVNQLAKAGPKYIQWIAKQYVAGQFKMEDVGRLKDDLQEFDRVKSRLQLKDINQYKDLRQLYAALKPFEQTEVTSKNQAKRATKEDGADKIFEDSDTIVYRLKTQEAACMLGRGTKWCTAATKGDNYFEYYNKKGPIFVVITKDNGEKYQFHFESEQFMDSEDQDIDIDEFAYNYPNTINAIVLKHPQGLRDDNSKIAGSLMPLLSEPAQIAVVELYPANIRNIPMEERTKKVCMTAMHKNWAVYRNFPKKFQTLALSYQVVQHLQKSVGTVWGEYIPKEHFAPIKEYMQQTRELQQLQRFYDQDVDTLKILTNPETSKESRTEESRRYLQELIDSYKAKLKDYKSRMAEISNKTKEFENQIKKKA